MFHWIKLVEKSASKLIIDESEKNYLKKSDKIVQYLSKKSTRIYKNFQNYLITTSSNMIVYSWFHLILV